MPLDDLPDWLPAWCVDQLGDEPVSVLFELRQISAVFGLRLAGGRDVVVKAREDDGRAGSCVAGQARLAERGFPCARPLTPVAGVGSLAVHAEEFRPGGELLHGDSPDVAARYAAVFARLMAELAEVTVAPPLPNPRWVRWDHTDSGLWPAIRELDDRDQGAAPAYVVDTAERVRKRMLAADLPCVLGHADFEAQNLRWHGGDVGPCTTGTAWRGSQRRHWRVRRAGRLPAPRRRPWPRSRVPPRSWRLIRISGGAGSPRRSRRSRGRPACGRRRTMPAGRPCTATRRCPVTPSAHRQPNAYAERTPSYLPLK
jgi:hypothetical protein